MPEGFKMRAHHNTDGRAGIKSGRVARDVEKMARRLKIPLAERGKDQNFVTDEDKGAPDTNPSKGRGR
jgi:hypothetical protein